MLSNDEESKSDSDQTPKVSLGQKKVRKPKSGTLNIKKTGFIKSKFLFSSYKFGV